MSAKLEGLKRFYLFHILIIAALAIGLYSNTLKNDFVYDDESTIVNNIFIKNFDNLPFFFDKTAYFSRSGEISYRPVVTFTYFIDYALYGLKPWGYHLTNVFLHAINGVLLYIFLSLLRTPYSVLHMSPTLLISLLFVAHPVLTETVNCISYREDLLAFLFYMATLIFYMILRKQTTGRRPLTALLLYLFSCIAYLLALLSKEMAVTLPLIVICYEWLYGKEKTELSSRLFSSHPETSNPPSPPFAKVGNIVEFPFGKVGFRGISGRRLFNRYIMGYMTITLFYLYLRFYLFHNPEDQIRAWGLNERFLTLPWFIINYLKLSLFPVQLSADYVIKPVTSTLFPYFIWPFISIVSILAVSFILRKWKGVFFGTLFFLATLLPVYNIVPISNPFAERYIYLPMAGFAIVLGVVINAIGNQDKRLLYISSLLILCIFAFAVVKRNTVWRDNYSLWTDTLSKVPNSSLAHNNIGIFYDNLGRMKDAILEYKKALSLNPDYAKIHYNLGNTYTRIGRMDDAVSEYKKALNLKPYYSEAHNNLANTYWHLDRMDDAISEYKEALRINPDYPDYHFNLGMAYKKKGLKDEARRAFEDALRLNPNDNEARQALESLR